ncbi:ornithine cyclodeaminase family protein [Streptomyces fuscichromogenes]|uniref:Ornithine cyclodeaminase n=1 Tax=Streptomyces fuscichromogenes TaxID=1324013 RepID=A0A917XG96_9ACTN|nr:ornithine cyclodeaminase family protein [Streptomyces fuscichromogenes]GGN22698.1 ornithine cyclodeaminase [Streptomyces fuscichromogenes]
MTGMRHLDAAEVSARVSMAELIPVIGEALDAVEQGEFDMPGRLSFGGRVLVMPAYHPATRSGSVKVVTVDFQRVPAISGAVTWTSPRMEFLADAPRITALRTGAIVGRATDLLAPPSASRVVLIGTGAQAADQVRAVAAVRDIRELVIVGRRKERADRLGHLITGEFPHLRVRTTDGIAAAVSEAEIVCCATSATEPLFSLSDLPARVHVNAIGSYTPAMRELPAELLSDAEVVAVESVEAATTEAGEIIHALDTGRLTVDALTPLARIQPGAVSRGRTVFKSVGIAAQDWAVCRLLEQSLSAGS